MFGKVIDVCGFDIYGKNGSFSFGFFFIIDGKLEFLDNVLGIIIWVAGLFTLVYYVINIRNYNIIKFFWNSVI